MTALTPFLRTALLFDAAVSSVAALGMIAGANLLAGPLSLPADLMFWAGVACIPFIALIAAVLRAGRASSAIIVTIIATNFAWVAGSLFIAFGPMLAPTLLGKIFVCAQAAAVFLFAELQIIGLRRMTRAMMA